MFPNNQLEIKRYIFGKNEISNIKETWRLLNCLLNEKKKKKDTQRIVNYSINRRFKGSIVIQKIVIITQLQNKFSTSNLSNKLPVDDISYEVYLKDSY